MSTMAWYPLPRSGSTLSAGDEFFENQSAGWSLWSFGSSSDDHNSTPPLYPVKQESGEDGGARSSEEQSVQQTPMEPQPCTALRTDDIFLSQFSDEEMRRMDAPFETLDMFPGSMHRLLSYEHMLSGVLTGVVSSEGQDAARLDDRDGVDAMDTCGFPLFSHDLQDAMEPNGEGTLAETLSVDEAGMGTVKRSRSFADGEGAGGFEALVLEELEDVVFQLTKKTRICFRDAFFRMAETSSKARCGGGGGGASGAAAEVGSGSSGSGRQSVRQAGCPERETNAIDRTVADLTMRPPCPAPLQVHGSCCAGGPGAATAAAAQPTASWMTRA